MTEWVNVLLDLTLDLDVAKIQISNKQVSTSCLGMLPEYLFAWGPELTW